MISFNCILSFYVMKANICNLQLVMSYQSNECKQCHVLHGISLMSTKISKNTLFFFFRYDFIYCKRMSRADKTSSV